MARARRKKQAIGGDLTLVTRDIRPVRVTFEFTMKATAEEYDQWIEKYYPNIVLAIGDDGTRILIFKNLLWACELTYKITRRKMGNRKLHVTGFFSSPRSLKWIAGFLHHSTLYFGIKEKVNAAQT